VYSLSSGRVHAVMLFQSDILLPLVLLKLLLLPLLTFAKTDICPFYDIDYDAELDSVCRAKDGTRTCVPSATAMRPRAKPFHCNFRWTNREEVKKEVLKQLKDRFKVLLYFKSHVKGYKNHELNYSNYTGWITWVWVLKEYKYLLNYPHNFYTLSLGTTEIVIEEFKVEGECEENCTEAIGYESCGLSQKDMVSFLQNITDNGSSYEWEKVCLHSNIGTSHLITPHSYTFLPDLLYYGYFMYALYFYNLTGFSRTKYFPNYYCYRSSDLGCESTPIWHRYNIIITFAVILWMYCPLLIYYFPSSNGGEKFVEGFYTSHTIPYHFMKFIRSMLCYYPSSNLAIKRIRRLFLLLLLVPPTVRMLLLSTNFCAAFGVLCICLMLPSNLSSWITPEQPSHFQIIPHLVKWPYPKKMTQPIKGIEYQLLANIMEERMLLIIDGRFWCLIYKQSCGVFKGPQHHPTLIQWICFPFVVCFKVITAVIAAAVSILYFFFPWLYFCKEILVAITRGEKSFYDENKSTFRLFMVVFHGIALMILFVFSMLCMFVYCFFLAEVTVYTLIGCVLTPDKAYKYLGLVGAFVYAIYLMVTQLQDNYSEILDEIIGSFNDKSRLKLLQNNLTDDVRLNKEDDPTKYTVSVTRNPLLGSNSTSNSTNLEPIATSKLLLSFDGITTMVSKELFHFVVEQCRPLRKMVFPILIRIAIMLFYIIIVMQAKNAYKLEKNVGNIFGLAQAMAITFVPAVMTYLGTKNRFGKKKMALLKINVHTAILDYVKHDC